MERGAFKRIVSNRSGVWFLLNGLVMVMGWLVITVGAARLMTAPSNPMPLLRS